MIMLATKTGIASDITKNIFRFVMKTPAFNVQKINSAQVMPLAQTVNAFLLENAWVIVIAQQTRTRHFASTSQVNAFNAKEIEIAILVLVTLGHGHVQLKNKDQEIKKHFDLIFVVSLT